MSAAPEAGYLLVLRNEIVGDFHTHGFVFIGLSRRFGCSLTTRSKQRYGKNSGKYTAQGQFSVLLYNKKFVWAPNMKHMPKSAIPKRIN
jgi:hypothetical protein